MSVHYQETDASGVAAYPADPQITIPFPPKRTIVLNQDVDGTDDIYFSFDGVNDHGHLLAGKQIELQQRGGTKVWIRAGATDTSPTVVSVWGED